MYNIIQIWHPGGVYIRNNIPERGLSSEVVARVWQSSRGKHIPGGHPTGMSYMFYYTGQNTKHNKRKNLKHQRFWINTRCLPCWTSFTGSSLGKLLGGLRVSGLACVNQLTHAVAVVCWHRLIHLTWRFWLVKGHISIVMLYSLLSYRL